MENGNNQSNACQKSRTSKRQKVDIVHSGFVNGIEIGKMQKDLQIAVDVF